MQVLFKKSFTNLNLRKEPKMLELG